MPFLILKVLDGAPSVKKEAGAYLIPDEKECILYIILGHEVLQIPRVARIEPGAEFITVLTHRSERFYFSPDQVAGIKLAGPERGVRAHAGFSSE